jgi:uncharacterized phage protein gp47/JayE
LTTGVTSTGFVAPTVEELDTELNDALHAEVAGDLDVSPDQPMGQIKAIFARQIAKLDEAIATAYNAFNPSAAEGFLLDMVCALSGTKRRAATYSTVVIAMTLGASASIPVGSIANVTGQTTNRWLLVGPATGAGGILLSEGPVTSTSAGVYYGFFRADTSGPRAAVAGTITTITVPVTGWSACTNGLDASQGRDQETDAQLRVRREAELTAPGSGAVDAIRADLLEVDGVQDAFVFENTGDVTDANGVPPHGIEAVVYDGASPLASNADIAAIIWKDKPAGAPTFGSITTTTPDSRGVNQSVSFSRPTLRRVYIEVATPTTSSSYNGTTGPGAIKEAIRAYWAVHRDLGNDVIALALKSACLTVQGVTDVPTLKLGFSPAPAGTSNLAISDRELATIDTGDISVT